MGLPECYEGGVGLPKEELTARGVNDSNVHVDFMVGTDDLEITGVEADEARVPVFCNGTWAWDG